MKLYKNGELVGTHHEPIFRMAQIGRSRDTDTFAYCIYLNFIMLEVLIKPIR